MVDGGGMPDRGARIVVVPCRRIGYDDGASFTVADIGGSIVGVRQTTRG